MSKVLALRANLDLLSLVKAIGENPRSIGASGRPNDCSQVCIQIASRGARALHGPPRCPRRGAVRRSAHLSPARSVAHARRHQSKKQPKRSVLHLPSRRWTRTRVVPHASATVSGDAILKASATLAAHGASAAASWWAEAPHPRGSGLNASAISSSQNRMCGCSTARSARCAGQQMAPGQRR